MALVANPILMAADAESGFGRIGPTICHTVCRDRQKDGLRDSSLLRAGRNLRDAQHHGTPIIGHMRTSGIAYSGVESDSKIRVTVGRGAA